MGKTVAQTGYIVVEQPQYADVFLEAGVAQCNGV